MRELQKGDALTADWLRDLVRQVRRNRLQPGFGLRLTVTDNGTVISLASPERRAVIPAQPDPYPFGPMWNFGVTFAADNVTVWGGLLYLAGEAIIRTDPTPAEQPTLSGLITGDFICVVYNYETQALTIEKRPSPNDADGCLVRALCEVQVNAGKAALGKWIWPAIPLAAKGRL